jgi:hypothetical protein
MPSAATATGQDTTHILGIRHHGPGSARSVRRALQELQPDLILVEGPPDAEALIPLVTDAGMEPPVALLVYRPDALKEAAFYPFAVFSPEWQALTFGRSHGLPVRFMDLPQAHRFALIEAEARARDDSPTAAEAEAGVETEAEAETETETETVQELLLVRRDPLQWLAEAAGHGDGERWWEAMVEHRRDSTDLFAAIREAMTALRESLPAPVGDALGLRIERLREAHMRQAIRAARREGFTRIAVICGAWHAPALAEGAMPPAKEDAALLKGLPRVKVQATWIPWTHGRLCAESGYGAGIESPGWYHHLWTSDDHIIERWLTRVARLLREQDLEASSAHVIEAVRLSETLASLRGMPLPGLPELNEAILAVFGFGDDRALRLVREKLIVGEGLGRVPESTPTVPLQHDLAQQQKRLRISPEAAVKDKELDLREPTDLERSVLLHRLDLLGINWGHRLGQAQGKGTFKERWRLCWKPESSLAVIEAGVWGNSVRAAAAARTGDAADKAAELPALTRLLDHALLADLPEVVEHVMSRVQSEAALASDVTHLMAALPPLAQVLRYSNVRQTDAAMVAHAVDGLVARITVGLPGACASLNDEAAVAMEGHILSVHAAVGLLSNPEHQADWQATLRHLADQQNLHGLIAGRCCRLLMDSGAIDAAEAARRLSLGLSTANDPAQAAAWVEGLLRGSGLLLLHDAVLWNVLDAWVTAVPAESFPTLLPLLRRTFATFPAPERRQMGTLVKRGPATTPGTAAAPGLAAAPAFDPGRVEAVLPLLARLLGIPLEEDHP